MLAERIDIAFIAQACSMTGGSEDAGAVQCSSDVTIVERCMCQQVTVAEGAPAQLPLLILGPPSSSTLTDVTSRLVPMVSSGAEGAQGWMGRWSDLPETQAW